jgi:hypothetical protein
MNLYCPFQGHKGLEGPKGEIGAPGAKVCLTPNLTYSTNSVAVDTF